MQYSRSWDDEDVTSRFADALLGDKPPPLHALLQSVETGLLADRVERQPTVLLHALAFRCDEPPRGRS